VNLILDEEQLKKVVHNVAKSEDGLKLLGHLLESSNAFSTGYVEDARRDMYFKGRADFGLEISELIKQNAFTEYVQLLKKGVNQDG